MNEDNRKRIAAFFIGAFYIYSSLLLAYLGTTSQWEWYSVILLPILIVCCIAGFGFGSFLLGFAYRGKPKEE
jgi:ABC-type polysaccharide/polyol phosphate export permease